MKIVDTDNFGCDYPNEKVVADNLQRDVATLMCDALNQDGGDNSQRYYKVVEDDYVLQPGFEV